MRVDFYMFSDQANEFSVPDDKVIDFDDANDVYNPFSTNNFKRSFEVETDDVVKSEIAQMLMKHAIMFGNEAINYNSLDKKASQDNSTFLKDSIKRIERHIARNYMTDEIVEKYMIVDIVNAAKNNNFTNEINFAGISRTYNTFLEFSDTYDGCTFSSRFQCYFMNPQYLQDAFDSQMHIRYARANPMVPMSSKVHKDV